MVTSKLVKQYRDWSLLKEVKLNLCNSTNGCMHPVVVNLFYGDMVIKRVSKVEFISVQLKQFLIEVVLSKGVMFKRLL